MEEAVLLIVILQNENEKLKKTISQMKFHRSEAGKNKMKKNNERRRNKTKFKRVLKELKESVKIDNY